MSTDIQNFLSQVQAQQVAFSDVIAFIEARYTHTPTAFKNGANYNQATENQGSAKVLYFAQLHDLTPEQTLPLFAEHYQSVLATPEATDHQNIRQFMQHGWAGVQFEGVALVAKV
ncbi:MAG: HopJ type III effector protein [Acinetobacter sp.]|nr:HopJ type III effector protein [Acinetobacter sp.]